MILISCSLGPARFTPSRVSPIRRSATCLQNWSTNISGASLPPVASCNRYEPNNTQTASLTKQTLCDGTVWSGVKLWRRFFSFCVSAASDHRDGSSDSRLLHLQRERVQLLRVRNGEQSLCCQISVCMQHFIGFTQTWRSQAIIRLTYVHVFTFVVVSLMWNMNVWRSRCVHESWLISCICLSLWGCRW